MSIKRYLFLLFSTLILTIAVTQIVLLYVFKANIDHEIDKRSRDFADRIINFAIENLDSNESNESSTSKQTKVRVNEDVIFVHKDRTDKSLDFVVIEIEQELNNQKLETVFEVPSTVMKQEQELKRAITELPPEVQGLVLSLSKRFNQSKARKVKTENADVEVKIFKPRNSHRYTVKQRLRHQVDRFKSEPSHFSREMVVQTNGVIKRDWLPSYRGSHRQSFVNKTFNAIFVLIIVTTLVALIMVFWLSRKFSEPLQQLSDGFKQLENGQFGTKIKPQGVAEIKQTIERFNVMSEQLVKLAEAEHKLMQQTHLTELSDISKGIAHALRNPMHTIGLAIEQLTQEDLPEPLKQKLFTKIQSKISQLDKNIKALLTVTNGEIDRSSEVVLLSVLQDIVLELKQSHQLSDIALLVSVNVSNDIKLKGSDKELRSVLHTLLFNAYEAGLEAGCEQINIALNAKTSKDKIILTVTDNGAGISEKVMARMFEPHNSSKAEGAGMGLYISKRIIELYYNGELVVENNQTDNKVTGVTAKIEFNKTNQE